MTTVPALKVDEFLCFEALDPPFRGSFQLKDRMILLACKTPFRPETCCNSVIWQTASARCREVLIARQRELSHVDIRSSV